MSSPAVAGRKEGRDKGMERMKGRKWRKGLRDRGDRMGQGIERMKRRKG
jgi:hypothetical protein